MLSRQNFQSVQYDKGYHQVTIASGYYRRHQVLPFFAYLERFLRFFAATSGIKHASFPRRRRLQLMPAPNYP